MLATVIRAQATLADLGVDLHRPAVDPAFADSSEESRGAVFTKPTVVDFILDLGGYRADSDLRTCRILEPAAGDGAFASTIVDRLLASYRTHGGTIGRAHVELADCVRAVELHPASVTSLRSRLAEIAIGHGVARSSALQLADQWVVSGDFLLVDLPSGFTHCVGNPPYVRQEGIPADRLAIYRREYRTFTNRADLYVPFFERSLGLLAPEGRLCFICSDRWMKNAYGKPLRSLISEGYQVDAVVDMVDTPAFTSEVIAYPAITLIRRRTGPGNPTMTAARPSLDSAHLDMLALALAGGKTDARLGVHRVLGIAQDAQPWLLGDSDQLSIVRSIEACLPSIEETGCTVGIGVATGCDRVYIGEYDRLDVEPERKLPLVLGSCIRSGKLHWGGKGLINPFEPDGSLADLRRYPRFAAYLRQHETALRARNVAKRAGPGWYRTIDRVWDHLQSTPKLLIPDIKGEPNVVIDRGGFYPHHNLYWVTPGAWGLEELQCVLRSTIAKLFVSTYCVKMAGGFLRFQAQYLRRIRIPQWEAVSRDQRKRLSSAVANLDQDAIDDAVSEMYALNPAARKSLAAYRSTSPCP